MLRVEFCQCSRRILAGAIIASLAGITGAAAQVTPVMGALSGSEGIARQGAADDILRNQIDSHLALEDAAKFSPGFTSFALGRIVSTDHDSYYQAPSYFGNLGAGQSVSFKSFEDSFFGGFGYRATGGLPDSRISITAYAGQSMVHTNLGRDQIDFPGQSSTGTGTNNAWLAGVSATYSVGNLYVASSYTHYTGKTDANETGNFPSLSTIAGSFGTSGYMLNGALGDSVEVAKLASGTRIFLMGETGLRHVDMDSDKIANRAGDPLFSYINRVTTVSGTIGAFAIIPEGDASLRPFVRLGVYHDTFYENDTFAYNPNGTYLDTVPFFRRANDIGKFEGGLSYIQGSWNLSLSGFTEWAGDQNSVGTKFGLKYEF